MLKLNIGAGDTEIEGWTPVDRKRGTEAFPLEYPDSSVDEIRASHILEHFPFADVPKVLKEWARVLKCGARIRIAVPDFAKIVACSGADPQWGHYVMGGQLDENDFHRSLFTTESLARAMREAGFERIQPWASHNTDTACHPISLNLEGFKRDPDPMQVNICAVMSIPRVGWNDNWGCVGNALRPFNIPVKRSTGAFWGQCMQSVLQRSLDEGVDWILAIDYDSVFTAEDVDSLLGVMGTRPEVDAVAALQARRSSEYPLLGIIGGNGEIACDGKPIKVDSAHFGLTIIRAEHLKTLQKPWFHSRPDENGDWSDNKIDDDTWFWKLWREAGHSIYIDTNCRIGHLQLMVSEFDNELRCRHVHVSDWWERQKNEGKGN